MPLKIRVRPEEKLAIGNTVLKNVGTRPADLLVLSDSPVLRDNYLMNIDRQNDSEASHLYFLLQILYLFKAKGQPLDKLVMETVRSFAMIFPELDGTVRQMLQHLEAGESFKALRLGHRLMEEQIKQDKNISPKGAGHHEQESH
ncbi:MAG: hypothetical protein IPI58_05635 [Alphaproteobacteria bacterium]|nr:MAG: hypothetical protein IPI58_05635 [Alphaproteobacteria bacterium]